MESLQCSTLYLLNLSLLPHFFLEPRSSLLGSGSETSSKMWWYKTQHSKNKDRVIWSHLVQFSSVAQSCPTLCDPVNCSTPGLPVHHKLLEFTQTHAHWVGDAIKSSHPLASPSPPGPNLSQHQGLFQRVNSSHEVAKVWKLSSVSHTANSHWLPILHLVM